MAETIKHVYMRIQGEPQYTVQGIQLKAVPTSQGTGVEAVHETCPQRSARICKNLKNYVM